MKKKGFTLIELLAVILILGIIALIAIPTINNILQESRLGAFNTTASELGKAAEKACQLEMMKNTSITTLYTLIDGEFDHQLDIKGKMPDNGYILVNNNCEVAYSFYDNNHSASKSFNEDKTLTDNKDSVAVYGLEWRSNISSKADTYKRWGDAASIEDDNVKVQVGSTPVTNAFDELDIYKDILPYTDSYGNEFMLIPKFYIKKTKVATDTEVIWEYYVSKHKLDNEYYLPANFVDERSEERRVGKEC